jgi:predicted alpha-1,6-mannanase (GH76 family)
LWPFVRAIVATLDLSGIREGLVEPVNAAGAIADDLKALERYWEPGGGSGAYASDVLGSRFGGDRYYDDNAWVGLALIQLERMSPGAGRLDRAAELFRFAVAGWDRRPNVPSPGGVFWVEQGRGVGTSNHDRNTVSNAPNAALGLHLAELGVSAGAHESIAAEDMYEWVNATLDAGEDPKQPATGLFWDKLCNDGTADKTIWSYNQGNMIGANVLLARQGGTEQAVYLARAESIARKALRYFGSLGYASQPAAFNAIFYRNLLLLHAATSDAGLRTEITDTVRAYADDAWSERRDRRDSFHFSRGGVTLLDQSAMVQVLSLLAWDPGAYRKLA